MGGGVLHPSITVYEGPAGVIVGGTLRSASPLSCSSEDLSSCAAGDCISEKHLTLAGAAATELSSLERRRLLVDEMQYNKMIDDRRFAFWSILGADPSKVLSRLSKSTVCVAGLGGVGSTVASCLAKHGVGKLILIDCDYVENVNLSKSILFSSEDIGKSKAFTLKQKLSPFCKVEISCEKLSTQGPIADVDFLVWTGDDDERETFFALTSLVEQGRFGLTTGGVNEHEICVGPTLIRHDRPPARESILYSGRILQRPKINPGIISSVLTCGAMISDQVCFALAGEEVATRRTVCTYDPIRMTSRHLSL